MASRIALAWLLGLGLVSYGDVAFAGDAPTAEALFRAGREASERGDVKVACERFGESYQLDPAPGTLLNIAACQEALHRLADAWESYQHVADSLAAGDDRIVLVNERIAALDRRLPRLTLEANVEASSLRVLRDGEPLSSHVFGVPLPVDPGEHRITVSAAGRQTREYLAILHEGDRLRVQLEPGDTLPEPPRPPMTPIPKASSKPAAPASGSAHGLRVAGYVAGGVGIAGFITMGVLSALAVQEKSTAEDHCPQRSCDPEGFNAVENGDRLLRLADVALVVGIVGVGAGGVLLWQASRAEIRVQHTVGGLGLSFGSAF